MFIFDWGGWAEDIMNNLIGFEIENNISNHTPFYQRKPNPLKELTTIQKIITYRFIKNYQDAKTISDSK